MNMIASHNNDTDSIWKLVKRIRADFLWKYLSPSFFSCNFIDELYMKINFDMLAEMLNVHNITEKVLDISPEKIEEGAKMFLYLNLCPNSFSFVLKQIFLSSDAYNLIMSTMEWKSAKGKELETMIKIYNAVSSGYGNNFSKILYDKPTKEVRLTKNQTVLNGKSLKI